MTAASLWVVNPSGQRASGEWIDDTLRARAEERGLLDRTPFAGRFPRQRIEVVRGDDATEEVNRLFRLRGWTDGLPIVPPTIDRVEEMLAWVPEPRTAVLGTLDPLNGVATVEKVTANAVMAGCRPEYLPVVLAAVRAIAEPAFNLRGVQTTDENVAPLLVVSGPVAEAIGMNASFGALGPGWQANATIGRAVRLVMNNIGGGWPAAVSFAGIGHPGRYTMCLAEAGSQSPWEPLHVELGLEAEDSAVVVTRAETMINVTGGLPDLASVMGTAASGFAMLHNGIVTVLLAPFVAAELAGQGLSKDDVKRRLWETARMPAAAWRRTWLRERVIEPASWPDWVLAGDREDAIPPVEKPEDITLIVAGGDIPIPQCAYFPSWGFPPCRIAKKIELPSRWQERIATLGTEPLDRSGAG